jgi:putative Mn2+ efflux pump MntP
MKNFKVIGVFIGLILITIIAYFFVTKVLPFLAFVALVFLGSRWAYKKMNSNGDNINTTETKS